MAWTHSPAPLYNMLCDLEHVTDFRISISFLKYLLSVALGLHCSTWTFSSCGTWTYCSGSSCCRARALGTRASVRAAQRLGSCGTRAELLRSTWNLPRPRIKPMSPALVGGFSSTAPPGKSSISSSVKPGPPSPTTHRAGVDNWGSDVFPSQLGISTAPFVFRVRTSALTACWPEKMSLWFLFISFFPSGGPQRVCAETFLWLRKAPPWVPLSTSIFWAPLTGGTFPFSSYFHLLSIHIITSGYRLTMEWLMKLIWLKGMLLLFSY